MIQFSCSKCDHEYKVPVEYAGKKARCKKCKNVNIIPQKYPAGEVDFSSENFDSGAEYHDVFKELLRWEKHAPAAEEELL